MPNQHDLDRKNDAHLLAPLLLMALLLAVGILILACTGHSLAANL